MHSKVKMVCGAAFGTFLLAASTALFAEEDTAGAEEYRISCAVCHGVGGRGDGDMSAYLTIRPSNLTILAKTNEGKFPTLEIFKTIDGRTVKGHGDRAMPVWGSRYRAEIGDMYGPYGGERAARARLLELVYYLESIQQ